MISEESPNLSCYNSFPPSINNITWPVLNSSGSISTSVPSNSSEFLTGGLEAVEIRETEANDEAPIKFMKINRTCEIIDEPFHTRVGFWRKLNLLPFKTNVNGTNSQNKAKAEENLSDNEIRCGRN